MTTTSTLALALLLLSAGIAAADERPDLDEGLWTVHVRNTDNPGNRTSETTYSICRDHAFDKASEAAAKELKGCTLVSESFAADTYAVDMRCAIDGTVIESAGTTVFAGTSATHTEARATYTPPMAGTTDTTLVRDEKFLGACPAGTEPGDRIAEDGSVTHLRKR